MFALTFLTHAGPNVCVNDIGSADRLSGIVGLLQVALGNCTAIIFQERLIETVALRGGQDEMDAELAAADGQRTCHIVAVADKYQRASFKGSALFLQGQQIAESLARVRVI